MKIHHFVPTKSGELIVSGKNKLEITLAHNEPHEIFVCFKDIHEVVPCNPNQFDDLEWSIHYKHSHYVLIINWEVSGSREIFWAAKY